jgi:hypothetical protein
VKVLFLTQTGALGPSSRHRVYQLLPLLAARGIEAEVAPAISDELYERIYFRGKNKSAALRAAWQRRRADLARVAEFDVVFVQKGVFPGLYSGFERRIAAKKPLVFDFDDAIWLPREGGSRVARALHRERAVQDILRCAAAVIAGNAHLAEYARRFNRNVVMIPTSLDTNRCAPSPDSARVGWIGSRTTLPYLRMLQPVLAKLGVTPRVIAAGDPTTLGFPVEFRPWKLETESAELAEIGIGIAPLPDSPWERGKCGLKILQYMACGIPVVASPVGVQRMMIQHGTTGFLADGIDDWKTYLHELIATPSLRQRLGAAGRAFARQRYDIQQAAIQVEAVLRGQRATPSM